jgi:hypothetical protein
MAKSPKENLLAQLNRQAADSDSDQVWANLAATPASHGDEPGAPVVPAEEEDEIEVESADGMASPPADADDAQLDILLDRVNRVTTTEGQPPGVPTAPSSTKEGRFLPIEPTSLDAAKITASEVEGLILKYLLVRGEASGHHLADQIRLPFLILDDLLLQMKHDQLVVHKAAAAMNDYIYQLTDIGRELGRLQSQHCSYFGSAPVDLSDYLVAIATQSLTNQSPTKEDLGHAFADLLINEKMFKRIGPAINSGRGMFLYGASGNGKTSIAERVTQAFGESIWIPRVLSIDGEIMRLYDPNHHHERPLEANEGLLDQRQIDRRWIRIVRPTIVVGGELTMENLEVTVSSQTGVSEAPVQLKSNCGTLVIDDFGRQRMSIDQLLNRWIVPLEKRYDFLNMPSGKKIQVPFDQLIVFSTNFEPRALVDDAFLRRVPYKIEVIDPTEEEFRDLFEKMAVQMGLEFKSDVLDYLIETHYRSIDRPFRYCQPRDLLMQICNFCRFMKCKPEMTREAVDLAVENYFSIM